MSERERIARIIRDGLDDGMGGVAALTKDLKCGYVDVGSVDLGGIADTILSPRGPGLRSDGTTAVDRQAEVDTVLADANRLAARMGAEIVLDPERIRQFVHGPRGEQTEAVARAVSEIIADLKLRGYANLSGDPDWCKEGRAWERIIARHPAGAEAPSVVGADWKRVEQIVQLHVLRACNRVLQTKGPVARTEAAGEEIDACVKALAALSPQALGEAYGSSPGGDTHRVAETPVVTYEDSWTAPGPGWVKVREHTYDTLPRWRFTGTPPALSPTAGDE